MVLPPDARYARHSCFSMRVTCEVRGDRQRQRQADRPGIPIHIRRQKHSRAWRCQLQLSWGPARSQSYLLHLSRRVAPAQQHGVPFLVHAAAHLDVDRQNFEDSLQCDSQRDRQMSFVGQVKPAQQPTR